MRFLFFQEIAAGPTSKSGQREPFGGRNTLFLLKFFSEWKVGNPTQGLRISKMARKTGRRWGSPLPPCACLRFSGLALAV